MNHKRIFLLPIMQLAAGLGWTGGTYAQSSWSLWLQILLQLVHYLPVALLLLCALSFLTTENTHHSWGRSGLFALSIFVKITTLAWIIIGFTHFAGLTGPHGFNDWFPIGVTNAGSGLLLRLLLTRRDQQTTQTLKPITTL